MPRLVQSARVPGQRTGQTSTSDTRRSRAISPTGSKRSLSQSDNEDEDEDEDSDEERHAPSSSSDKENRVMAPSARDKGKGRAVVSVSRENSVATETTNTNGNANKRRRVGLSERHDSIAPPRAPTAPRTNHTNEGQGQGQSTTREPRTDMERDLAGQIDTSLYDPDQAPEQRREVRRAIRDVQRDLADNKTEYMSASNDGLQDLLNRTDSLFDSGVRQTAEAAMESRVLVSAGDLGVRRARANHLGAGRGVDINEFVNHLASYMKNGGVRGNGAAHQASRRRERASMDVESDDEVETQRTDLDWAVLGKVCFSNNLRPAVPTFLLGPLSLQKRRRAPIVRKPRTQRQDASEATQPERLDRRDIEQQENSNLTNLCRMILNTLNETITSGSKAIEARVSEFESADGNADDIFDELLEEYALGDDRGACLYRFAFNPLSFGQTVENLFYICFLIRDGKVGVESDSRGLPTLHIKQPSSAADIARKRIEKHQGVFHIDFDIWTKIIEAFEIKKCRIPNRVANESGSVGVGKWYA